jgi:hypothetical protein
MAEHAWKETSINMSGKTPEVDLHQALRDPGATFSKPEDLLVPSNLSVEQKIEILRRWEYDVAETDVAEEEGMRGPETDLRRRIILTLDALAGAVDTEHTAPSKQHAL